MSERPQDRNLWTVRLLSVVLFISVIASGLLAAGIASLFPIKEVRPFLVNFADRSEVVATVIPVTQEVGGFDALARSLAKQYVVMRHSVVASGPEMEQRWGENGVIFMMSRKDIYAKFLGEALQVFKAVQNAQATVSIDVKGVTTIEPERRYQVEFVMESRDKLGKVTLSKTFLATMDVEFSPLRTSIANSQINPTGFTVVAYSNVEKGS